MLLGVAAATAGAATPLPLTLTFAGPAGGVSDGAGVGTGFAFVLPDASGNAALDPWKLQVDEPAGLLRLTTSAGLAYRDLDNLENALGLRLGGGRKAVTLTASLVDLPALDEPWRYQQAGLWVGPSQDTYVKVVVIASDGGARVHALYEQDGAVVASLYGPLHDVEGRRIDLRMRVVARTGVLTAAYSIDGGAAVALGDVPVAPSLFDADGFAAGIFGSHRRAGTPTRFDFDAFGAACADAACSEDPRPDPNLGDGTPPVGRPGGPQGEERPGTAPAAKFGARLRAAARVRARKLRRGLGVQVRCTLACRYELQMQIPARYARRLGLTRRSAAVTVSRKIAVVAAGRTARAKLRPVRRHRAALLQSGRRVPLKVRLVATAGAGTSVSKARTVVLRPARR